MVECYAGSRGEEEPRAFLHEGRRVVVDEIVERWRSPDHRGFRVRARDGRQFVLRHEEATGAWQIEPG